MDRPTNSRTRFSDRVANYVRYRPSYPTEVIEVLKRETGLMREHVIADVGSGTGISAKLFLRAGNRVFGVEPNAEMRSAAESLLRGYPGFVSVDGSAEATTLPEHSVDYVVAAQAFHWFDPGAARDEFRRVLLPAGWVVLLWNSRRTDSSPFLIAYESLLRRYGTDYEQVQHTNIDIDDLRPLFAGGSVELRTLDNEQRFDLEGLSGRLLSSSYAPAPGHPAHGAMMEELEGIFEEHSVEGSVTVEYDTEIYFGRVG